MIRRVVALALWFAPLLLALHVFGSTDLKIAVVNQEASQTESGCSSARTGCSLRLLSCRYLAQLARPPLALEPRALLPSALLDVERGQVVAVVYLNENFTDAFVAKMALGDDADFETISTARIQVWLPRAQPKDTLVQQLQSAFDRFTEDILTTCEFKGDSGRFTFDGSPFIYQYI